LKISLGKQNNFCRFSADHEDQKQTQLKLVH